MGTKGTKRNVRRVIAAGVAVMASLAVLPVSPSGADPSEPQAAPSAVLSTNPVVDNDGPITVEVVSGNVSIGEQSLDLPACEPAKTCTVFPGTVTSTGRFVFPNDAITFPPVEISDIPGLSVTVKPVSSGFATGRIEPRTGAVSLAFTFSVQVNAPASFAGLIPAGCSLGPVTVAMTTGTSGSITGKSYVPGTGALTIVDGRFTIPAVPSTCGILGSIIEQYVGDLPLSAGQSTASFNVRVSPLIVGDGAPRPDAGFTDVRPWASFVDGVDWLKLTGITNGTSATTFSPDRPVTRAEIATFIWRLWDSPSAPRSCGFTDEADIPNSARQATCWLRSTKITESNPFRPKALVTRGQMAAMLHRAAGLVPPSPATPSFADVSGDASYADATRYLREFGISTGVGGGNSFAPESRVNRGQMAAFLYRLASRADAWNEELLPPTTVLFTVFRPV